MKKTGSKLPQGVEKVLEKFEHKNGYRPPVHVLKDKTGKPVAYFRQATVSDADSYEASKTINSYLWQPTKVLLERCFLAGQEVFRKDKAVLTLANKNWTAQLFEGTSFEVRKAERSEVIELGDVLDAKRFNPNENELIVFEDQENNKKAYFYEATLKQSDLALAEYSKSNKPYNYAKTLSRFCYVHGDKDFFEDTNYILGGLVGAIDTLQEESDEFDLGNESNDSTND